jgi:hypothetical protein
MRIRDFSIRINLVLLILFASALAVALASLGFAVYERQSYRASAVREVTALADTVGANTAASLAFNDRNTAEEMLGALATEPHILVARLYDTQGRIFAEYRRAGGAPGLPLSAQLHDGKYFDRNSLALFRGVVLNGERTGSIALVFDLSDFRSRLLEYLKIAAIVFVLSVLITFLASLRLAGSIGNPLVNLAAVARHISVDKDYSIRARIQAGGDTGLLIDAFNEMLSHIQSRESELNNALKSLKESEERYAWLLAARMTASGTGTLQPTKSTFLPAGTICLVMRQAKPGPVPNNGSTTSTSTTRNRYAPGLPHIAKERLRSSSASIACATNLAVISGPSVVA